jgi:Thioredoxin
VIPVRFFIVVVLVFGILLLGRLYRQWRARVVADAPFSPLIPESIRAGAERTWVVFTTPYCASCGPIEARLRASDPSANVVSIDATQQQGLAGAFRVRSAPTVLLADADGRVKARLVGVAAFDDYVRNPA